MGHGSAVCHEVCFGAPPKAGKTHDEMGPEIPGLPGGIDDAGFMCFEIQSDPDANVSDWKLAGIWRIILALAVGAAHFLWTSSQSLCL